MNQPDRQCPIMLHGYRCIYVVAHSGEHYAPQDGRDHSDEIRVRVLRDDRDRLRLELQAARTDKTFEQWWADDGRMYDPDTEDVPWFDKRKELAELAFVKGVEIGMARSRNYTANRAIDPDRIHFANGRIVKLSRETGRLYLSILEGDKR